VTPRSAARAFALAAALAAPSAAAEPPPAPAAPSAIDPPPAVYATGPEGRRFRIGFDPGSRIWLGIAGGVDRGPSGAPAPGLEIDAGLGWRNRSAEGEGKDRVSWQVDHRIVSGWVRPVGGRGGIPPIDASLYNVSMLRHDASPSIVLPTSPPVGIPFPFDVGFDAEVGRFTTLAYPSLNEVRVGVAHAAVVLDPWRSGAPGRSFAIGLGARYDLETATNGAKAPLLHRVAPMTAASLRFRFQDREGITVLDTRTEAVPHYTSEGTWRFLALSSLHFERALIAISDQPIAAVLDGSYRYDPPRHDAAGVSDFRVTLGLSFNLMLRR
jgi:hypothetical protein